MSKKDKKINSNMKTNINQVLDDIREGNYQPYKKLMSSDAKVHIYHNIPFDTLMSLCYNDTYIISMHLNILCVDLACKFSTPPIIFRAIGNEEKVFSAYGDIVVLHVQTYKYCIISYEEFLKIYNVKEGIPIGINFEEWMLEEIEYLEAIMEAAKYFSFINNNDNSQKAIRY